jgi:hypothetical protein
MKKLFLCLSVMVLLPIMAFADLGIGVATFLKSPVLIGQPIDTEHMNVDQFSFGANLLYKLGWFQVEGLLLYSTGDIQSLNFYLDAGVALDVSILRLSIGAGPNFVSNLQESHLSQAGLNAKIGADVVVGKVSMGLSYIMALNFDNGITADTGSGLLGIRLLLWL